MSTLYFSGIEKTSTARALLIEKAPGMMSQLQYRPNLMQACTGLDLVMDSGAYSKVLLEADIRAYAELITRLGDRCIWYANADCIGDMQRSNDNYDLLISLLPPALHDRVLWIYQYGSDQKYLYNGLEKHHRIGIGGLVPLLKDKERAYQIISNLARTVSSSSSCVPHYFGISSCEIIKMLHQHHDNFSVDSTTWLAGSKYGLLINSIGQQKPASAGGYDFSTESILTQNVRTMRKWIEQPVKRSNVSHIQLQFDEMIA